MDLQSYYHWYILKWIKVTKISGWNLPLSYRLRQEITYYYNNDNTNYYKCKQIKLNIEWQQNTIQFRFKGFIWATVLLMQKWILDNSVLLESPSYNQSSICKYHQGSNILL